MRSQFHVDQTLYVTNDFNSFFCTHQMLLKQFDIDENGVLTFEEFLQAMPAQQVVIDDELV